MFKILLYKWHRRISLIIALPVLLWALSGFMHPIMTNIRPKITTQFIQPQPIDVTKIRIPLEYALSENQIVEFHNFRIVSVDTNWFYQVQIGPNEHPVYLSAQTGQLWLNGDELYAQYIARQFLEGPPKQEKNKLTPVSIETKDKALISGANIPAGFNEDAVNKAATRYVEYPDKGAVINGVSVVTAFDREYKFVNRLLPVYKVQFERKDKIRVYVQTTGDRFAYAVDDKRAIFDQVFGIFHNWNWLNMLGKGKYLVMATLLTMAFFTTVAGLYLFFTGKTVNPRGNTVLKARRNHRITSISVSLFTLMFTFSGAFHALEKLKKDDRYDYFTHQKIKADGISLRIDSLYKMLNQPITNISTVQMENQVYWQIFTKSERKKNNESGERSDLMKDRQVPPPNATYIHTSDLKMLPQGERKYAKYLAGLFSGHQENEMRTIEAITKFEGEYGFVNKRLPVWKVAYDQNHQERYYVETNSGKLSVRIDNRDLLEGYSFSYLHKHHFMDWGGKSVRDFSTMFWAMSQIFMVAVGLILWSRTKKRKVI